jgi:hypothetical protein
MASVAPSGTQRKFVTISPDGKVELIKGLAGAFVHALRYNIRADDDRTDRSSLRFRRGLTVPACVFVHAVAPVSELIIALRCLSACRSEPRPGPRLRHPRLRIGNFALAVSGRGNHRRIAELAPRGAHAPGRSEEYINLVDVYQE